MSDEVKRIDITEFREMGFLQELNRQFLHPLGLALEVIVDEEKGEEKLGGIWDYRDDPEGIVYHDSVMNDPEYIRKAKDVQKLAAEKADFRLKKFGWVIQPVEGEELRSV